jgi:uncharacterized protein (DUF1684 family)
MDLPRFSLAAMLLAAACATACAADAALAKTVAPPPTDAPPLSPGVADSLRAAIEDERRDADEFYRTSPHSPLAAVARADFGKDGGWLTIGRAPGNDLVLDDPLVLPNHARVKVAGTAFRVETTAPGATVRVLGNETAAADAPPTWIGVGRHQVRLSYQNAPALIACDPGRPQQKEFAGLAWWPVDFGYRFVTTLETGPREDTVYVESTNGPPRPAARAGWFTFRVGGKTQRLSAYRLLEPGANASQLSVFFRDGTSGKGSYGMGRYVDAQKLPDGRYVLDFNRATNPYCAVTEFFNCPIPPKENRLTVSIPAGEAYAGPAHAGTEHPK